MELILLIVCFSISIQPIVWCVSHRWLSDRSNFSNLILRLIVPTEDKIVIHRHQWTRCEGDQTRAGAPTGAETRRWLSKPLSIDNRPSAEQGRPSFRLNNPSPRKEVALVCLRQDFPAKIFKSHLAKPFAQPRANQLGACFPSSDVYVEWLDWKKERKKTRGEGRARRPVHRRLSLQRHRLELGRVAGSPKDEVNSAEAGCHKLK
jgi:hypothetical protein